MSIRVLVGIASFGVKNIKFLHRVVSQYLEMPFQVEVVVFSEAPKNLDPRVKVVVGLPTENPWSLPFAHRQFFVDNLENFDLFIYSEDDMVVTTENLRAFLDLQRSLKDDEVAGFIRFEVSPEGAISLPDFRDHFHWRPESARSRGDWTVAEFSNAHSALYVLARNQLARAVRSGGYSISPHEGEYDMLCSAATDPYVACGLRRVIGISDFSRFLVLHAPNRYVGKIGLSLSLVEQEITELLAISSGKRRFSMLIPSAAGNICSYYRALPDDVTQTIAEGRPEHVLTIGAGFGDIETSEALSSARLTALPLDSVIGSVIARTGIDVVNGTLSEGLDVLRDRRFDVIVVSGLYQHFKCPQAVLTRCMHLLSEKGRLVIVSMNSHYLRSNRKLSGCKPRTLDIAAISRDAREAGLVLYRVAWHGYQDETLISGALHAPTGWSGVLRRTWNRVRIAGATIDILLRHLGWRRISNWSPGRWLAIGMALTFVRGEGLSEAVRSLEQHSKNAAL